jgi:Mn2+/Fe2+ NRAMP family transporter
MTRSSAVMGRLRNGPVMTFASWALVVLISGLNVYLLAVTL